MRTGPGPESLTVLIVGEHGGRGFTDGEGWTVTCGGLIAAAGMFKGFETPVNVFKKARSKSCIIPAT